MATLDSVKDVELLKWFPLSLLTEVHGDKCANRGTLEYVRTICTRLGIGTYGITEQVREGFPGREPSSIFRVHFVNEDLTEEFFLLDEHRYRFQTSQKAFARRGWLVKAVKETARHEVVFAAVDAKGGPLALEDNLVAGSYFAGCGEKNPVPLGEEMGARPDDQ